MLLPAMLAACVVEGYVPGEMRVFGSDGPERFVDGTFNAIKGTYQITIDGTRHVGTAKVGNPGAEGGRDAVIEPGAESALSCHFHLSSSMSSKGDRASKF